MTRALAQAARELLADSSGEAASGHELARRAGAACEQLTTHLSKLLGETGVRLMLNRSVIQTSARFPWLATASSKADASSALRTTMEPRDPAEITEAFVAILSAFIGLLERLLGTGLVERLLDEVWPRVFTHEAKDSP